MKNLLQILILTSFIYSCTPPLYVPTTTITPTLIKEGDIDGMISTGTNGTDLQGGYAIKDNFGVIGLGSYKNSINSKEKRIMKHKYFELGAGYSYNLNENNSDESKVIASIFGGAGLGSAFGNYNNNIAEGNFQKFFIQPNFGYAGNYFEIFLNYRISLIHFNESSWKSNYEPAGYVEELTTKGYTNTFSEPTLHMSFGAEKVKFFTQFGWSQGHLDIENTGNNKVMVFRQQPFIFIIGFKFDMNVFD